RDQGMIGFQPWAWRRCGHGVMPMVVMVLLPAMAATPMPAAPERETGGIPQPPIARKIPSIRDAEVEGDRRPVTVAAERAGIRIGTAVVAVAAGAGIRPVAGVVRTAARGIGLHDGIAGSAAGHEPQPGTQYPEARSVAPCS